MSHFDVYDYDSLSAYSTGFLSVHSHYSRLEVYVKGYLQSGQGSLGPIVKSPGRGMKIPSGTLLVPLQVGQGRSARA
ncbi:hypothetical protein LCGC14_0922930 [marine sediment metagenome]|uniref:Uncharacterized protein n=1 Tax=marine sediment metagenome TaxID=412755 RepID=A0A0F9NQ86_9ZZZZ